MVKEIDYVEIYTPMAKALAYWHVQALGFRTVALADVDSGRPGMASYVLESGRIRLVLTACYPMNQVPLNREIHDFISRNYCGVRRVALQVESVSEAFEAAILNGAIPTRYPERLEDAAGTVEEAAVKLYDSSEIVFIDRERYTGIFKPGYREIHPGLKGRSRGVFKEVDHIAAEVRINEGDFWTQYLEGVAGTSLVQSIGTSEENHTGMVLRISQSGDRKLTFVIAEPETYLAKSKVQKNIESFGPGIHHLAFSTDDFAGTVQRLEEQNVEFVQFPASYYDLLRSNPEFRHFDIDSLQKNGILVDQEGDSYLMQKFIKPLSDRPFFFYEIVQRVNGYNGFALGNINVLKKAEELEIMRSEKN